MIWETSAHFIDSKTKSQRDYMICPKSHTLGVTELSLRLWPLRLLFLLLHVRASKGKGISVTLLTHRRHMYWIWKSTRLIDWLICLFIYLFLDQFILPAEPIPLGCQKNQSAKSHRVLLKSDRRRQRLPSLVICPHCSSLSYALPQPLWSLQNHCSLLCEILGKAELSGLQSRQILWCTTWPFSLRATQIVWPVAPEQATTLRDSLFPLLSHWYSIWWKSPHLHTLFFLVDLNLQKQYPSNMQKPPLKQNK